MSSDDTAGDTPVSADDDVDADVMATGPQEPQWANDAARVDVLLDEDDPHSSVMELLVGDLEGRLGAVHVELGPMEVRALLRQLEDVQLAQQISEWEAEGNDIEDFPLDGTDGPDGEFGEDEDDDELEAPPGRGAERLTDPLAVKTWMSQDYRLFGIQIQYLLVGMAVVVGVIMATVGVIL